MRTTIPAEGRREEILLAFQRAAPRPTIDDIAAWIKRHPDLADDIRAHAELLLEIAQTEPHGAEPSPELLARGRAAAMSILAEARARVRDRTVAAAATAAFPDLTEAAGTSVPALAREIDIGRAVLTDLVQGRMRLPLPRSLARALADALRTTAGAVEAAAAAAAASPRLGYAKARGIAAATPRTFEEIVRDDPTMTEARKAFWLTREN